VFGALKIKVDPNKPVRIVGDAVFAGISLPNGNSSAFGRVTYDSRSFQDSAPAIKVTVKTVFGGVEVE
jgi:predicted membrane protein